MPRPPRFQIEGIPQLIHQRGHNGTSVCVDQADYHTLYGCLAEAAAEHRCDVHAYALLETENYLLVTPMEGGSISRMMQAVGRQYVPWFNAIHERSGALWEGRYRACIVEPGLRIIDAYRFIEEQTDGNRSTDKCGRKRWSSAATHLRGCCDSLVDDHLVYRDLGVDGKRRAEAYAAMCERRLAPEVTRDIVQSVSRCLAYASEPYKDFIEKEYGFRVRPGQAGRPRGSKNVPEESDLAA